MCNEDKVYEAPLPWKFRRRWCTTTTSIIFSFRIRMWIMLIYSKAQVKCEYVYIFYTLVNAAGRAAPARAAGRARGGSGESPDWTKDANCTLGVLPPTTQGFNFFQEKEVSPWLPIDVASLSRKRRGGDPRLPQDVVPYAFLCSLSPLWHHMHFEIVLAHFIEKCWEL